MMKKYRAFIGIMVWGCIVSPTANAQQSNIAKQRLIMDEAISTIEDYETFATIADEEIRYSFENLFVDENAYVYNDLLGISQDDKLTIKEYSKKLSEGLRNKKTTISNIKKDKLWYENDTWKIRFSFPFLRQESLSYQSLRYLRSRSLSPRESGTEYSDYSPSQCSLSTLLLFDCL